MGDGWHCPRQLNGIGASLRLDTPRPENSALSGLKQFRTPGVSSPRDAANPVQCCPRAIPPLPHKCNWPFYIYTPFNEGGTHNYSSALSELTAHIIWTISCGAKRRCPRQQLQGVADSSWRSGGQRPVALLFMTGRIQLPVFIGITFNASVELTAHIIGQFPVGLNGVARGNNCRGLLIALGEAEVSALWLCRLSQGAPERAIEISAFSCSCKGNAV